MKEKRVKKRNGEIVPFQKEKIVNAVLGAYKEVYRVKEPKEFMVKEANEISDFIYNINKTIYDVEWIQNIVEIRLMKNPPLAKAYILYRYKHEVIRQINTTDKSLLELLDGTNDYWQKENSNKDATNVTTIRDYMAGITSKDITERFLLPEDIVKAHQEGIIHFHDSDYFAQKINNCCLINLEDMLQNTTVISKVMIDKPHSFRTACTIATQIIAKVASSQYGGQSITLSHLAPFVDISRQAIRQEVLKEFDLILSSIPNYEFDYENADIYEELVDKITEERLRKEIADGVQTIQYQVITLMTTNGQAPFISIFMYLGEVKDKQTQKDLALIIEEVLKQRIKGVKNENGEYVTPAFPKLLFVLEESNIRKDGEYYYLRKLAVECSAKRLVPDYISEKKMLELKEGNCFPCMGCVTGDSKVQYRMDDRTSLISIDYMWEEMSKKFEVKHQFSDDNPNLYIDLEGVSIYDTKNRYVNCQRIIRNTLPEHTKLYTVVLSNGYKVTCTFDHPFDTENRGRVSSENLVVGDVIAVTSFDIHTAEVTSIIVEETKEKYVYDVTTDSDHFEVNNIYSHNCRSFLAPYKDENGNYKFYGRFNQGVVTINLVDVALSSKGDIEKFWSIFDERLELCHRALLCRHERLEGTLSDVAPILWQHGAFARLKKGEKIDKLLHNGYSSISLGYAGLYECVKYMTGCSHTDGGVGTDFGLKVMQKLKESCEKWNEQHNIGFSLYGTPIESTTEKFAKNLRRRFGTIEDITDHDYITNSYHVNVREKINAYDKLKIESKFQEYSTGGAVSYIETPNLQNNLDILMDLTEYIYNTIMYAEFNSKSDNCLKCNFEGEVDLIIEDDKVVWKCPKCGNTDQNYLHVARRTCGYIGENFWCDGRTKEIADRVLHIDDVPCLDM